jgi:hypothetical protein
MLSEVWWENILINNVILKIHKIKKDNNTVNHIIVDSEYWKG